MELTYFVHSTSADNESGLRSGWRDPLLSQKGKEQALSLRDYCEDLHFDTVFCSDLRRAVETAEVVFGHQTVIPDSRLREMNYGILDGSPASQFPRDELECIDRRYELGENCHDVEARVRLFIEEYILSARYERVAIVSHKYPQLALDVICNHVTWKEAIQADWRIAGNWQPGWLYKIQR
jgi:broad specificity phosphatase PhoE